MSLLEVFLTAIGGTGVALAVAAYFARTFIDLQVSRVIEKYKAELQQKSEVLKTDLCDASTALNADPKVMAFFASPISRELSDASIAAWQAQLVEQGWSNWAAEIGWRLARAHWGQGYATEAARAALRVGFEQLQLPQIVSFTAVANRRARAVMERIGMRDAGEDFEHPGVPVGHALRLHCLYRLTRDQWRGGGA